MIRSIGIIVVLVLCGLCTVHPVLSQDNPEFESYRKRGVAILGRIAAASGTLNVRPELFIEESPGIAHFDILKRSITVDPKLFRVADEHSLNPDAAIAYVMGHEYAHYVRGHDFNYKYGHSFGEMLERSGTREDLDAALAVSRQAEFEADYYGLYYAYLAGYRYSLADICKFMDAMNDQYGRGFDIAYTHPTWSARKLVVDTVLTEFGRMTAAHYAGIAYLLHEDYRSAAVLFEWISGTVPVAEAQWNELLARMLAVQKASGREFVNKERLLPCVNYRPRFRGGPNDDLEAGADIVDLAWIEQQLDKCASLVQVLRYHRVKPTMISSIEDLLDVMQKSFACKECTDHALCTEHSSLAKSYSEQLPPADQTMQDNPSSASSIEALMKPVRTKLLALRRFLKSGSVETSDGELSIVSSIDNNRISGSIELLSRRGKSSLMMLVDECKNCTATIPQVYDRKVTFTAEGQRLVFSINEE